MNLLIARIPQIFLQLKSKAVEINIAITDELWNYKIRVVESAMKFKCFKTLQVQY